MKKNEEIAILKGQQSFGIVANNETNAIIESEFQQHEKIGHDARQDRENEIISLIVDSTIKDLPESFKRLYYETFSADEISLKFFIKDYIKKTVPGLNEVYYDEHQSMSTLLREQTWKLQSSIDIQKKRWYNKTLNSIEKKDRFILSVYKERLQNNNTLLLEDFLIDAEAELNEWYNSNHINTDNNTYIHMINYPFF